MTVGGPADLAPKEQRRSSIGRYERLTEPLAPMPVFVTRLLANFLVVQVVVAVSLLVGMWGYHELEGMNWIDAFANASMILSGMGPLGQLHSNSVKLFAGCYALYSGLLLIAAAGVLLAPALHRFLHSMHLDDDDGE